MMAHLAAVALLDRLGHGFVASLAVKSEGARPMFSSLFGSRGALKGCIWLLESFQTSSLISFKDLAFALGFVWPSR